tara:strand:- start:1395 stop:1613 length:219 start_codon:yes stop_codon:yes gene_type:complete
MEKPKRVITDEQREKARENSRLYRQKNSEVYKQKQKEQYYKNKQKRLDYQLNYDRTKRTEFLETKKTETLIQ